MAKKKAKKKVSRKKTTKKPVKKTKVAKPKETPKKQSDLSKLLALGALVLIVVLLALTQNNSVPEAPDTPTNEAPKGDSMGASGVMKDGDLVSVRYVGRFTDGEMFDTNDPQAAQDAGFELRTDQPFSFALGRQAVVPGFEAAVRSLKVGERKTFNIPAAEAYGERDPAQTTTVPRTQEIERLQEINRSQKIPAQAFAQIFAEEPVVGKIYTTEVMPWDFEVTAATETEVTIRSMHTQGQQVRVPGASWDATVTSFNEKTVTLRADPSGDQIETPFGPASLETTADMLIVTVSAVEGAQVPTALGVGVVSGMDDENIIVDLNHPLAGRELVFEIELLDVRAGQ